MLGGMQVQDDSSCPERIGLVIHRTVSGGVGAGAGADRPQKAEYKRSSISAIFLAHSGYCHRIP